jgi:hypothetical protein
MDPIALLITNPEAPLLEEPFEVAFDHGMMLAQAASVFGVPSRDSRDDPSLPERFADLVFGIVSPVCVQRESGLRLLPAA